MIPSNTPVRHGYTIRDIDLLARSAVRKAYLRELPAQDRYDEALSAIGLHLAAVAEAPTERELRMAGIRAILDLHRDDNHHHGVDTYNPHLGRESMPRYQAYWAGHASTPSPEDRVIDRVALAQIWPELSPMQTAALVAYAEHEDHTAAREAIGAAPSTYKTHLKRGRDHFLALWHENEIPSTIWFASRGGSPLRQALRVRRWYRARKASRITALRSPTGGGARFKPESVARSNRAGGTS